MTIISTRAVATSPAGPVFGRTTFRQVIIMTCQYEILDLLLLCMHLQMYNINLSNYVSVQQK